MKIKQLSVFLENKPGQLSGPCRTLAKAGVNILTLSLADTDQFGIMRLILPDWEKAREALTKDGWVVKVTDVVAVEVEDRPGGMADVLEIIESSQTNIEYMYAFTFRNDDRAVLVFRFDDPDAAIKVLIKNKVSLIGSEAMHERAR